ncbi:MAG: methyltransferase domain-containing protein [Candidatus Methanomethylicia archaeon]
MDYVNRVKRDVMNVFDDIAEEFDVTRVKPWSEIYFVSRFGGLIADFGCGSGRHVLALVDEGCEVLAMDVSRRMVSICLSKVRGGDKYRFVSGVVCDLNFLPLKPNSINHALCLATIHHIPLFNVRLNVLNEIYMVLKNSGILVLSVWALYQGRFLKYIPKMIINRIIGRVKEFGDIYVPWKSSKKTFMRFHHLFSKSEFIKLCRSSKFKLAFTYGKSLRKTIFHENHMAILFKM